MPIILLADPSAPLRSLKRFITNPPDQELAAGPFATISPSHSGYATCLPLELLLPDHEEEWLKRHGPWL